MMNIFTMIYSRSDPDPLPFHSDPTLNLGKLKNKRIEVSIIRVEQGIMLFFRFKLLKNSEIFMPAEWLAS